MKQLVQKLLLAFLLSLISVPSYAYDFKIDDFCYEIISAEDKTVKIVTPNSWYDNANYASGAVVIPDRVKHEDNLYTVTEIGTNTFRSCAIISVKIPNTIVSIGNNAFTSCSALTSVIIPNSVGSLGDGCFSGCSRLGYVEIGNSVKTIGSSAFAECSNITNIEIPEAVTSIGASAFSNCVNLDEIVIPNSVESLGNGAFSECRKLKSVKLPDGLKEISSSLFAGCKSLTSLDLPSTLTSIGYAAFSSCPFIEMDIPDGVKSIGQSAFQYNTNLTKISMPESLTSIGVQAFWNCTNLIEIRIPAKVTSIDIQAFEGCRSLANVIFEESDSPEGLTIGKAAFTNCEKLASLVLPNSVKSIGSQAFRYCSSLQEVKLPDGLTSLPEEAFFGCPLTAINLPETLTSIGSKALVNGVFNSIVLPESLVYIGNNVFPYNLGLIYCKSIVPPGAVTGSFEQRIYSGAILCVPVGSKSRYEKMVPWRDFAHIEEVDFEKFEKIDLFFDVDGLKYKVTSISDPTVKVTYLEKENAGNSSYVTGDVVLPDKVERNGVTFTVAAIDDYAFYQCGLTSIVIPSSIETIGNKAFYGTSSIENVYCYGETAPIGADNTFGDAVYSKATLHVPQGKKEEYAAVSPWSLFANVEEIGQSGVSDLVDDGVVSVDCMNGSVIISGYDGHVEVYNVNGQRVYDGFDNVVNGLAKGFYIIRLKDKTVKMSI